MFVDASILVAIINREAGWEVLSERLADGQHLTFSSLVRFEAVLGVARAAAEKAKRRATAETMKEARISVEDLLAAMNAEEISLSSEIGSLAIEASMRYGKAVGHPADLNMGDCFAYACAKSLGVPLLYKGDDFPKTDLA